LPHEKPRDQVADRGCVHLQIGREVVGVSGFDTSKKKYTEATMDLIPIEMVDRGLIGRGYFHGVFLTNAIGLLPAAL
jgi:hypothetical protein